jgi:tetratricopeptide (TPR) repeat protein
VVICDDLRCKNCSALNDFALTREAIGQIAAESLKLLALYRSKASPPPYYPVKHVETGDKKGESPSLVDLEKENVEAALRNSSQPKGHLALGKFYEYVKVFAKARTAFLKALDLDARALEGMAGLARLDHAEGKLEEAYDWIDRCYKDLPDGRIYLAQDSRQFKKAVREKRREFARSLGIHPDEAPVKVRFQIDSPDFPKNRPCPCGSGKKYKLCCMPKGSDQG